MRISFGWRFGLWACAGVLMAQDVAFVTLAPKGVAKVVEGAARARRRLSPCSTFKIPNAVIGLETGVIPSPDYVIPFDAAKHKTEGFWIDAWSKDLDLGAAFRISAVWYFRDLATRVGPGNMKSFIDRFQYGNRDISGWKDPFWIRSTLRISPVEQVEFLDRLFRNEYGLTQRNVDAVESFMKQEEKDGRGLYFKTGACTDPEAGPEVWFAGFVQERKGRTYFALNMGGSNLNDLIARRNEIVRQRLSAAGLW